MPDIFCLADPLTRESSREMQAPHCALLLNCDSQHSVPDIRTCQSHGRGQVLKSCNQLRANEFGAQQVLGVRMYLPDSGHSASNRAAHDRESPNGVVQIERIPDGSISIQTCKSVR
jgi:hypothetical protein